MCGGCTPALRLPFEASSMMMFSLLSFHREGEGRSDNAPKPNNPHYREGRSTHTCVPLIQLSGGCAGPS